MRSDFTHDIPIPSALLAAATVLNKPLRMRVAADYGSSPDYDYNSGLEYGQLFLRISQIDKDGTIRYFTVIKVNEE